MYGSVQPVALHACFNAVDSLATTVARLSDKRPAIGSTTLARIFPSHAAAHRLDGFQRELHVRFVRAGENDVVRIVPDVFATVKLSLESFA
jgi:hypothetical protein